MIGKPIALLLLAVLVLGCLSTPSNPVSSTPDSPTKTVVASHAPVASVVAEKEPTAGQVITNAESETASIALNTQAYRVLAEGGIDNALVDVTEDQVLVGFPLPSEIAKEDAIAYAFGAMAGFHPDAKRLVVQIMDSSGIAVEQFESTPSKVNAESDSKSFVEKSRVPI